jgi:hypothetical protein
MGFYRTGSPEKFVVQDANKLRRAAAEKREKSKESDDFSEEELKAFIKRLCRSKTKN